MDRIDRFRIFTRVVECASFTRAADQLGLPRSTVSAAIAELEQRQHPPAAALDPPGVHHP